VRGILAADWPEHGPDTSDMLGNASSFQRLEIYQQSTTSFFHLWLPQDSQSQPTSRVLSTALQILRGERKKKSSPPFHLLPQSDPSPPPRCHLRGGRAVSSQPNASFFPRLEDLVQIILADIYPLTETIYDSVCILNRPLWLLVVLCFIVKLYRTRQ
jgi:hypothetical protein